MGKIKFVLGCASFIGGGGLERVSGIMLLHQRAGTPSEIVDAQTIHSMWGPTHPTKNVCIFDFDETLINTTQLDKWIDHHRGKWSILSSDLETQEVQEAKLTEQKRLCKLMYPEQQLAKVDESSAALITGACQNSVGGKVIILTNSPLRSVRTRLVFFPRLSKAIHRHKVLIISARDHCHVTLADRELAVVDPVTKQLDIFRPGEIQKGLGCALWKYVTFRDAIGLQVQFDPSGDLWDIVSPNAQGVVVSYISQNSYIECPSETQTDPVTDVLRSIPEFAESRIICIWFYMGRQCLPRVNVIGAAETRRPRGNKINRM